MESKFLQKIQEAGKNVKDWVTGESGPAIKVGAAAETPEKKEAYEQAKTTQKENETKKADFANAEKKRLATTSKAVEEKTTPAQAAKETNENLEETQEKLATTNDVTDKSEKAIQEQKNITTDDEKDFEEEVGKDEEVTKALETKDPNSAKEATLNYLMKKGLVKINDDGSIDFGRLKQTPSSIFSRIGTVISALLAVMTGGAIPPVNFYKLSGMEDEDKKRQELYQNLMDNLAETAGQVGSIKEKAAQSPETAEKAGAYDYKASGAYAKDMQSLRNTIETMRESNANAKDYAQAMIEMNARSPQALRDYLTESGLTKEEYINLKNILDKGFWTTADLQKWGQRLDNIGKGIGAAGNVVGTVAKGM